MSRYAYKSLLTVQKCSTFFLIPLLTLQFMGSPISPLFAGMVMDDLESDCLRILKDNHKCSLLFYYRYVDDTILCVQRKHIDLIINTFDSYHQNLQFTHELQKNNSINFLDMTHLWRQQYYY